MAVQSLSDSTKYKYRCLTLRRLGINDKSLFKTIRKQLLILFCVHAISTILCSFDVGLAGAGTGTARPGARRRSWRPGRAVVGSSPRSSGRVEHGGVVAVREVPNAVVSRLCPWMRARRHRRCTGVGGRAARSAPELGCGAEGGRGRDDGVLDWAIRLEGRGRRLRVG